MGNRILKKLLDVDNQKENKTFYTRDAQGNVLSIYENGKQKVYQDGNGNKYYFNAQNELIGRTDNNGTNLFHWTHKGKLIFEEGKIFVCIAKIQESYDNCAKSRVELTDITDENLITQTEVPIYGSDRIGTYNPPSKTQIKSDIYILNRSYKRYELKDHLGNVRVTVSDSKRVSFVSETLVFSADIKTYTDYYAFGMEMVGRNWSEGEAYRFGHNGQEKSKEVGEGNYTAEFWEYDSQVIRRFNTDPIVKEYESPYLAFGGNPIWFSDVNGDDAEDPTKGTTTNSKSTSGGCSSGEANHGGCPYGCKGHCSHGKGIVGSIQSGNGGGFIGFWNGANRINYSYNVSQLKKYYSPSILDIRTENFKTGVGLRVDYLNQTRDRLIGGRAIWDYVKPVEPKYWSVKADEFGAKSTLPARFFIADWKVTTLGGLGVAAGGLSLYITGRELYNGYQQNRFSRVLAKEASKSLGAYGMVKLATHFVVTNPSPHTKIPWVAGVIVAGSGILGSLGADVLFDYNYQPSIKKDPFDLKMPSDKTRVNKQKFLEIQK